MIWRGHQFLLQAAAYEWSTPDALATADGIVVLGGGAARPYAAAQLYRRGFASRILVDEPDNAKTLLGLGIPPQFIEVFGRDLKNTYEEACAVKAWAQQHAAHRFIVPTEQFPSRRVKWILGQKLRDLDGYAMIDIISPSNSTIRNWWQNRDDRHQFGLELAKYLYYRVRYMKDHC
jgi:uncharacterized SAM-binding protein YcdF (DUF218 family)